MVQSHRAIIGQKPSTATPQDSALIIIDAQNEYATGKLAIHDLPSSRAAIVSLLKAYRTAGQAAHIVHVLHETSRDWPMFTVGTPMADEFPELTSQDEKVVKKKHLGAFTGSELGPWLEQTGLKKVVLCGYMSHGCVSTTARQAEERGFDVLIARDAVGTRDIPGAEADELLRVSLAEVGDIFGTVIQSKDLYA